MTGGNVTKKQCKELLLEHFTEQMNKLSAKELKQLVKKYT